MRDIALLMVVLGALPMAFLRPIIGLILWVVFSYMNPHRLAYGFALTTPWVMIVALVTLFSMAMQTRERQPMHVSAVTVLMLAFLVWTGVTTLLAVQGEIAQARWIEFFKILLMAFATTILITDERRMGWVIWAIVLSFGFWGFKGGLFTILTGGGHHVLGPEKSFFRDNNDFALVMCMTVPLMRYLQLRETRRWMRYGLWVLIGLTMVAIVGTYSRGGFLGLSIVTMMLMIKSRRRAGLMLAVPALAVAVASFMPQQWYSRVNTIGDYKADASAQGRLDSWRFATNVAMAHPLTGGGFRVSTSPSMWARHGPPGAVRRAIHSIYFSVLADHGFVGLGLFLGMLIVGWRSLARIRQQARAGPELYWAGDLASMIQVSLLGFAAAGAFLPMAYFDLFYQMLAITVVLQLFMARAGNEKSTRGVSVKTGTSRRGERTTTPIAATQASNGSRMRDLPWW